MKKDAFWLMIPTVLGFLLITSRVCDALPTGEDENTLGNEDNLKNLKNSLLSELSKTIQSASNKNDDQAAIAELMSNKNVKSLFDNFGDILNSNANVNPNDFLNSLANNLENKPDILNNLIDMANNLSNQTSGAAQSALNNLNLNDLISSFADLAGALPASSDVVNQNDLIQSVSSLLSNDLPKTIGELRKEIIKALLTALNRYIVETNLTNQSVADMITDLLVNITNGEPASFSTVNQIISELLPFNMTIDVNHATAVIDAIFQGPTDLNEIDYQAVLAGITSFLQSNGTMWGLDAAHINEYIPNLIANLSQAQSLEQAWAILDPVIATHINLILNKTDGSMSSTIDVITTTLIQILMNTEQVQAILNNPTLVQILNVFNQTYTLTNNSELALEAAFNEMVNIAYTDILDQLKQMLANIWPSLYDSIKNDTDAKVIIGKSAGAAFDAVENFLNQFGITIPPKTPPSTTPGTGPTSTNTPTTPATSTRTTTLITSTTTPMTTTTPLINNYLDLINQILANLGDIEGQKPDNLQPV